MTRNEFECNGYTIVASAVRPIAADHFTGFGEFRKGGRSVRIPYQGVFATEELALEEVRARAPADAMAAPSAKVPF